MNNTTTSTTGATLTQKELFQRFLDAPFYERGEISTLVATRRVSDITFGERLGGFNSGFWPDHDLHEFLLDELRNSDDPEYDLDEIVNDIAGMLRDFEDLRLGFVALCAATRTAEPHESASYEVFREWEDNPRYVLPEAAAEGEAA